MSSVYNLDAKEFAAHIEKKLKAMADSVPTALALTAMDGAVYVRDNTIPVAFGELRDATEAHPTRTGAQISTRAPHAGAVEMGSQPHTPPIEPLIKWVKLRGMQGLTKRGAIRHVPSYKTSLNPRRIARIQAGQVATALKSMESGGALSTDAPEQVARAIQHAISKHGTKPYKYMFKALPKIVKIMVGRIKEGFQRVINGG